MLSEMNLSMLNMIVSFFYHLPVHDVPQGVEMRSAAILVVQVVGVLPDVEGEEGFQAVGNGIVGVRILADG